MKKPDILDVCFAIGLMIWGTVITIGVVKYVRSSNQYITEGTVR